MCSKLTAVFVFSIGALCCGALLAQTDPSALPAGDGTTDATSAAAPTTADTPGPQLPAFYGQLAPYGTWIAGGPHGWMWVPAAVPAGWRPYTVGHWALSTYGWTWMSDEPFGSVTYHYGRWFRDDERGWAWLPAADFGPAWVDWRAGDGYVGWAPLPPDAAVEAPGSDYSFVRESELLAPRVPDILLPAADTEAILPGTAQVAAPLLADERPVLPGEVPVPADERPSRFRRMLPYINAFLEGVAEATGSLPTTNGPHASAAVHTPPPPTGTAHPVPPATPAPTATAHPTAPGGGSSSAPPAHPSPAAQPAARPAVQAAQAQQSEASRPQPQPEAHPQAQAPPPAPPAETHVDHH